MGPSVWGLGARVYGAYEHVCMGPRGPCVWGLEARVYEVYANRTTNFTSNKDYVQIASRC